MIVVIIILLCSLALLSIMELSFSSLNIIRIKRLADSGNKSAKLVYRLYSRYSETLTTILIINCICSVLVSTITTYYFSNLYGDRCIPIVTLLLTLTILIFTEIIPKILGREYAEDFSLRLSHIINFLVKLLSPINKIIGLIIFIKIATFSYPCPKHIGTNSFETANIPNIKGNANMNTILNDFFI